MSAYNSEINLYVDALITQSLLTDYNLVKNSQDSGNVPEFMSGIIGYFKAHFDEKDKIGSVINFLAPGTLLQVFRSMNMPYMGTLIAFLIEVFNVDVNNILKSICDKITNDILSGKQITSSKIDNIIDQSIEPYNTPVTDQDVARIEKRNSIELLRDAKFLKAAIISFEENNFIKKANYLTDLFSRKSSSLSIFSTALGFLFKIILSSAGLMIAGDIFNKFLGRPNALDGTLKNDKPVVTNKIVPKQNKFKLNPSYREENYNTNPKDLWIENITNNKSSISNMLLNWSKQVYQGLENQDANIRSTAGFQILVETITDKNENSSGGQFVFIPQIFNSKKSLVDLFIDEVAEKAG